jgi:hypothetical protein
VKLGDLVRQLVGEERFTAACVWAYNTATDDEFAPWPADLAVVPGLLQAAIWDDAATPAPARIATALELYEAMPCETNALALARHWDELAPADRDGLTANDDERLTTPLARVM